jgi:hypothetical protein
MPNIQAFMATLKNDVVDFAQSQFKDVKNEAIADGTAFVKGIESDLQNWMSQLAAGKISRDDLQWLVNAKKDDAQLEALKVAGLAQVRRDQFVNGLLAVVVDAAINAT